MDSNTIVQRYRQLESQRKSLDGVLNDIDRFVQPYRGEFFNDMLSEHQVDSRRIEIFDSTAITACNLLASKIHSNLISPVTQWYRLRFRDNELNTEPSAKEWLEDTEHRVWQEFTESNLNNAVGEMFKDISSFGTSIFMQEQKDDIEWKGIEYNALPVMDSYFEMGPDDVPFRLYRKLRYTRLELEERFDLPEDLRIEDAEESSVDAKIEVVFCVYQRHEDTDNEDILKPEDRPFGYKYVMLSSKTEIEEGGYYQFPGMVVRWEKTAGSKWGNSPAMAQLSNIKQLNELAEQTSEARAKAIDPPMKTTDRGVIGDLDSNPGGITVVSEMDELQPLFPPSDFSQADTERFQLQEYIRDAFFVTQLELKESPAMTATEVNARMEQTMRLMSTVASRVQTDFMKPLLQFAVNLMLRQGRLMEMPESVMGQDLDIQYTGPIPRAQKSEIADGIIQWLMEMAQLAELFPEMLDIPDVDEAARTLQDLRGVPAELAHTQDEVDEIRAQRQEQQQQMQEAQQVQMGGEAAKAAGEGAQALQAANLEAVQ